MLPLSSPFHREGRKEARKNVLNIVLELPPAPAALVLAGRAFAACAALSAAFRRRMAVLGPPGGVGDEGLDERAPPSDPEARPVGEVARGEEDC